jgi:ferredoxin-NADP reductase/ferredoxin
MTTHTVELHTRDGERVAFECPETVDVVTAAASANLTLPASCREGGCGTCRGTCRSGDYQLGSHSTGALTAEAAANGEVLLCRTFPRGPLTIAVPFDRSHILAGALALRQATVTGLARVADRTMRLVLELLPDEDGGRAAGFEPGQYMELEIPGSRGVRRAYSIANTANWDGRLEFFIRLHPDGRFSRWLESEAAIGQIIDVRGPQGTFGVQENGLRPRWMVAGGTGLAPLLSMLRRMAEWQEPQPVRLFFGVNTPSELFALDDLSRLEGEMPQLQVVTCVRQPGDGQPHDGQPHDGQPHDGQPHDGQPGTRWSGFVGTPADALDRDLATVGTIPDLYLCGPSAMIDAVEQVARRNGVSADRIVTERFPTGGPIS